MAADILLLTLISLPLLGSATIGLLGKNLPKLVVGTLATSMVAGSFICALIIFSNLPQNQIVHLFSVVNLEDFKLNASFQIDSLSIWMTLIITGIGSLIHLFSIGYMSHDEGFYKFFAYLNLFIFSMLLLVLGSNPQISF